MLKLFSVITPMVQFRSSRTLLIPVLILMGIMLVACGVDLQNPPRLATATARAALTPTPSSTPIYLPAPVDSGSGGDAEQVPETIDSGNSMTSLAADGLTIWVDEVSPEHKQVLDELAGTFADQYGTNVAVQLVSPALLPKLVSTAVLSGTLPDLILYPNEYTAGWVEDGILDPTASNEVVDRLGRQTFDPAAVELLTIDGQTAAVPSDGYHQLLLYRADWFEEWGLRPPDTYTAMAQAAERIHDPEAIISGLVIPTESNLITTHQAFEQIALGNGCRLIAESGEVTILEPACEAAIEHYYSTINQFSPSGVQTDTSAAIALLTGRTGMIMSSPAILPDLAGLNPSASPSCDECDESEDGINYLARNIGIVTEIDGPNGEPAAFGNIRNLGITTAADREAAQAFAEFWFSEAYEKWLAVNSERKVPMRLGTEDEPTRFIDSWGRISIGSSDMTIADIYGEDVVQHLRDGIASAPRWGIREGYGALMSKLYGDLTISIVLQEMLSGYFDTSTTLREAYRRTVEFIPNYAFPDPLAEEVVP